MDYSPGFQFGHALSFQLANKIVDLTPDGLDQAMPPLNWVVRNALSAARVYS
jgi:hypothetical protein